MKLHGFVYYQAEVHCVRQLWTKLKLQMNLKVELYQNFNVLLINNWIVYFFSYLLISSLIFYWFATKNKDLACFMPNNVLEKITCLWLAENKFILMLHKCKVVIEVQSYKLVHTHFQKFASLDFLWCFNFSCTLLTK